MADRPYRPSNGTEGCSFMGDWCEKCQRDAEFSDQHPDKGCQILADTFAFDVDDLRYPKEWVSNEKDGPRCTAFIPLGQKLPPSRCDRTLEMFPEAV